MYFPTPPLLPVPLADPVALPENPYELEHLRGDIKRWLEEREAEGIELKRTLNVFLAHVEAFKAGRLLDLPDVPAFMEERERASLYTAWEWPIWAACRFNSEDCEQVAGFDQQSRFFVQELADLLNEPKPDTCQAARLSYRIVEAQRAQAVSPMQRLLKRVTARIAELKRDESRIGPAGAGQMTEVTATSTESQQSQDGSSGGQQPVILTSEEYEVLKFLEPQKHTYVQEQLQNALTRNKLCLNDKTLSRILKRLEELGFINRPHGPKKGVAITEKGRKYLA